MASKITAGQVAFTLAGTELILAPTLDAMTQISRQYGGLASARAALVNENFDAVSYIVRIGTSWEASGQAKWSAGRIGNAVWKNGITAELLIPLIKFVNILGNGGKPLVEDSDEDGAAPRSSDEEPASGNF